MTLKYFVEIYYKILYANIILSPFFRFMFSKNLGIPQIINFLRI